VSDKVTWSVRPIDAEEAHVLCTCGDVSVCISEDEAGFSLAMWIRGNWLRTDNPLWPDLLSAMAEAERICRGEDA